MNHLRFSVCTILLALLGASCSATAATNYFTEYFYGDYDLGGMTITFDTLGTAEDWYRIDPDLVDPITDLPVYPGNGYSATTYSLTDYDYVEVNLPAGKSFPLYGTYYDKFWLYSDGTMSFGGYYYSWYSNLSYHFAVPRVSPFFTDLNPGAGGTITVGELDIGVGFVVTFQDVPRWNSSTELCTFQCILYYTGSVEMSWLHSSYSGTAIVGLSKGNGIPGDYSETDLFSSPGDPNDLDADGLPDSWENFYFGSYTNCAPDGHGDTDSYDNYSEYVAGTIPNDSSSYFAVSFSMGSSQLIINWNSLSGRTYSIMHTDTLSSPFTNLVTGLTTDSYTATIDPTKDSGFFQTSVQMAP